MIYSPHEYQEYAKRFIIEHPEAAIFLDCGMGKTVITLTAIQELINDYFDVKRVLVIAPLRVGLTSWPAEIAKWDHLKNLRYRVAIGSTAKRIEAINDKTAQIVIINRENVDWLIKHNSFDYDMVVIDELSSFKSHKSKRFKALMSKRPFVKRIVGLTGTPSSNGLMDLWAEFKLLDMGKRLGRFIGNYREWYFRPDKMNGPIVYSYKPMPFAEKEIYEKISDITISMSALDHLKMPELIINEVEVEMNPHERRKYDSLKQEMVMEIPDGVITAANAASLTNKLCQMSNGRIYDEDKNIIHIHDRKLDALEDIIEAAQGPILLCYWFKHDLERIEKKLQELKVSFDRITTEDSIRKWNAGKLDVGLIHPASAGHGLNLQQGGNVIVWFGLTWSLELYQQTNARLWRQGQSNKTVVVQHIVTAGTIDEDILDALTSKDANQNRLINAVKAQL